MKGIYEKCISDTSKDGSKKSRWYYEEINDDEDEKMDVVKGPRARKCPQIFDI